MAKKAHTSPPPPSAAIDAMLALAAERGWHAVSLADIAQRAKISLVDLHEEFDGKSALLREFLKSLDGALLRGDLPGADESVRDHLFDVIMRRFDAMQPHKAAIRSIIHDSRGDPWLWLCGGPHVLKTAALMLEAAGISASGPVGRLKAKGLAAIYLSTVRVWLADDTPDMAKTMSTLDRSLRRAEGVAMFVWRTNRRPAPSDGDVAGESHA